MRLHLTSNQLSYQYSALSNEKCGRGEGHHTHTQHCSTARYTSGLKISQQPHSNSAPPVSLFLQGYILQDALMIKVTFFKDGNASCQIGNEVSFSCVQAL